MNQAYAGGHGHQPLRIAVLLGGNSAEREVSRESGQCVAEALRSLGHSVVLLDPAECALRSFPWSEVDVAFIALHGGSGEDGTVQALLARLGVPYTGSSPEACRMALSKRLSKERFRAAGLVCPPCIVLTPDLPRRDVERAVQMLGYPVVIKPDRQGSSVGVSVVHEPADLEPALTAAARFDPVVIAERYIAGRELTVALLGLRTLPPVEILYYGDCFSYHAKYHDSDTQYEVPANLSPRAVERVRDAARRAVLALGCSGLTRVDLRLDDEDQPWLLELNAVPGLTAHSLAPLAARAAGMSMAELCQWMVCDALCRGRVRRAA